MTVKSTESMALRRRIRVRREDSVYVYCIFESYEGIVSYSTLGFKPGDPYRDLELTIPQSFAAEVDELLKLLGDQVYELDSEN